MKPGIFRGDKYIWLVVGALSLLGILAVYSATGTLAFSKRGGNTEFYFIRHTGFLLIGLFFMYLCHLVNYRYFSRISLLMLWISIGLLVVTLAIGSEINDATRVLPIPGLGITFQTSDMAKLFLIMYIARYLAKNQDQIESPTAFWRITAIISIVVLLIAPENLSTALVLFSTCMLLLFIGRIHIKYIAMVFGTGALVLGLAGYALLQIDTDTLGNAGRIPTWKKRIESFIGKEKDSYQSIQSKIAISTGGLTGKGPGGSTQRNYLPHPYSDFIYSIIVEEYGLLGGLVVIVLFLVLLYRCLRIVVNSPRAYGAFLAIGLCLSLVIQAFINMGVAVGILPVTGLTIPLVSMGGTSLLFTSIAFGVILSVSRSLEEEQDADQKTKSQGGAVANA
ncbi:MAG: FtsW/RodA/SpoVE family cell cycle protein [Bacteroidia bacterium]|jgi:cell division protein FtsW